VVCVKGAVPRRGALRKPHVGSTGFANQRPFLKPVRAHRCQRGLLHAPYHSTFNPPHSRSTAAAAGGIGTMRIAEVASAGTATEADSAIRKP